MKFRTEIHPKESTEKLTYKSSILFLGSCFSVNIHNKLKELKFNSVSNPFGIVYNPISLAQQVIRIISGKEYNESDLHFHNERWFSFDHHSDFSFSSKSDCLTAINDSLGLAKKQLLKADFLFLTLGSSWIYNHNESNEIVSNCHKLPSKLFTKKLASSEEMKNKMQQVISDIQKINPEISIVLSISPVRHLADGNFENQLSKGRLFDLIYQLQKNNSNVRYFEAFELLHDDLRDYRFYNADLVHPSTEAVEYIWEKFINSYVSVETQLTINKVEKIVKAVAHRPFNSTSLAHKKFIVKTLNQISEVSNQTKIDFTPEIKFLKSQIIPSG